MKVTRLEADKVHGYLPIRVVFESDVTFLTGLNGSGKTTALRLLMGLLAPNLEELADIHFHRVAATVSDAGKEIVVEALRSPDSLTLSTSEVDGILTISAPELELISDVRRREGPGAPVYDKIAAHPVFKAIATLSTPMFLGLDRRFSMNAPSTEEQLIAMRRREAEMTGRVWHLPMGGPRSGNTASLADVNALVSSSVHEIRAKQEQLDEKLRSQILLGAFRYEPSNFSAASKLPKRAALDKYRSRLTAVEKAAAGLRLPAEEVQAALNKFLERMNQVVDDLEKEAKRRVEVRPKDKTRKKLPDSPTVLLFEWLMNKPQADRIFNHIVLLEQYGTDRSQLHEPIDRFLALTNSFLNQTNKRVQVSARGTLQVVLGGELPKASLSTLSSGEQQLVIMLAHLSLNPRLKVSGVFIVDEPELSLHLGWQERFVDAIQEANPNVQLIMATHSPSIIMDQIDRCKSLS